MCLELLTFLYFLHLPIELKCFKDWDLNLKHTHASTNECALFAQSVAVNCIITFPNETSMCILKKISTLVHMKFMIDGSGAKWELLNYSKYIMVVWSVCCRFPTHQVYGVSLLNLWLFSYMLGQNWREIWCLYDVRILTGIAVWMSLLWLERGIFAASTWVADQFVGSSQMNDCAVLLFWLVFVDTVTLLLTYIVWN